MKKKSSNLTPGSLEDRQSIVRRLEAELRSLRQFHPAVIARYEEIQDELARIRREKPKHNWPIGQAAIAELKKKPGEFVEGFELARRLDAAGAQTFGTRNAREMATVRSAHANVERIQRSLGKLVYSPKSELIGIRLDSDPSQVLHIGLRGWKIPAGASEARPRKDWAERKRIARTKRDEGRG